MFIFVFTYDARTHVRGGFAITRISVTASSEYLRVPARRLAKAFFVSLRWGAIVPVVLLRTLVWAAACFCSSASRCSASAASRACFCASSEAAPSADRLATRASSSACTYGTRVDLKGSGRGSIGQV
eukprot:1195539-Prorocentrum_minimum.AAC.12